MTFDFVLSLSNVFFILLWLGILCSFCYYCGKEKWKDKVLEFIAMTVIIWGDVVNDIYFQNIVVTSIIFVIATCVLVYNVRIFAKEFSA